MSKTPAVMKKKKYYKKISLFLALFFGSLFSFQSILFAMPSSGEGKSQSPNLFLPILLSFAVVYLLIIRPQQRKEKQVQLKLRSVEKGDEVVTKGGLMGRVTNVAEKMLTLEIADKTRVKIDRTFVHMVNKPKT